MIASRIQIGDGFIEDFYEKWGFIYMSSDHRFAAPEKKRDTSSYAEEAGAHEDPRTVDNEFDYSAKFLIEAPNQDFVNANAKISAWNNAVREKTEGSDIKTCKTVTFYDDYKRCKIVGIPEIIAEVDEDDYYRRQNGSVMDCVKVTLTIHVSRPQLCDFNTSEDANKIALRLLTDGDSLYVNTSRPLESDERVALLRCGRVRNTWGNSPTAPDPWFNKGKFRWHVTSEKNPLLVDSSNRIIGMRYLNKKEIKIKLFSDLIKWGLMETQGTQGPEYVVVGIIKAGKSIFIIPCIKGRSAAITFGIAIYKGKSRISDVVYFKSHVEVLKSLTSLDEDEDGAIFQYLSVG